MSMGEVASASFSRSWGSTEGGARSSKTEGLGGGTHEVKPLSSEEAHVPGTAKKNAKIFAAVLLLPILVPLGLALAVPLAIAYGVSYGSAKVVRNAQIYLRPESPIAVCKRQKDMEELGCLEHLRKVILDKSGLGNDISFRLIGRPEEIRQKIVDRHINRMLQSPGLTDAQIKAVKDVKITHATSKEKLIEEFSAGFLAVYQGPDKQGALDAVLTEFMARADDILSDLSFVSRERDVREQEAAEFKKALLELDQEIHKDKKNVGAQNGNITKKLRVALNCRAYQAMKYDTECESVKYLHKLAYAIHTSGGSANSQMELAGTLLKRKEREGGDSDDLAWARQAHGLEAEGALGPEVVRQFKEANAEGRSELQLSDGGFFSKIAYGIVNPRQVRGALASLGGIRRKFARQEYDPHLLSNNSSLQGTSEVGVTRNGIKTKGTIQNIYGPSPTLGEQISPEFLALCQGAENNLLWAEANHTEPDPELPVKVVFTNLQKLDESAGEGVRSRLMMHLNDQFPGVCTVITLSKDSSLYRMPHFEEDPDSIRWYSAENFADEMRAALKDGVEGQGQHASQIYFPKSFDTTIFDKAILQANKRFGEYRGCHGKKAYELRGAYQEYVYQLIQKQMEIDAVRDLNRRGIKSGNVVFKASCKEHADRGGTNSMAMAYLRSEGKSQDEIKLIVGAGLYRALVAKARMVLDERTHHILSMIERISPQDFQEDIAAMNENIGDRVTENYRPSYRPNSTPAYVTAPTRVISEAPQEVSQYTSDMLFKGTRINMEEAKFTKKFFDMLFAAENPEKLKKVCGEFNEMIKEGDLDAVIKKIMSDIKKIRESGEEGAFLDVTLTNPNFQTLKDNPELGEPTGTLLFMVLEKYKDLAEP